MPLTFIASAACLISVSFMALAIQGVLYTGPTTFSEGNQLHAVLRVARGDALYLNFHQMPAIVTPYPPAMFLLDGMITRIAGLELRDTVTLTRSLTVVFTILATVLIALLARHDGARWILAFSAAGLFLGVRFLDGWAFTTRADLMALAMTLLAAWLLQRRPDAPAVAAAVSVIAFFTKQTMVSFPLAAVIWLVLSGRRVSALVFATTWGIVALSGFLIGQAVTDGNLVLNTVVAHLNPTNGFDVAIRAFLEFPKHVWLPIGLAIVGLVSRVVSTRTMSLTGWYWLIAVAFALYTLRGRGASTNYFLEPAALACVLAAGGFEVMSRAFGASGIRFRFVMASTLAAVTVWAMISVQYWGSGGEVVSENPVIIPEVINAERILSEEPSFIVLAGKPLLVTEGFAFSQMAEAGRYDPSEVVRLIKRHYFDLIIIRGDARSPRSINGQLKWAPAILREVADSYVVRRNRGGFWLYVPDRPRSAS
ncbi:MAG: hypothetical protein ACKVVP_20655 [Chloroflexota bacterium]